MPHFDAIANLPLTTSQMDQLTALLPYEVDPEYPGLESLVADALNKAAYPGPSGVTGIESYAARRFLTKELVIKIEQGIPPEEAVQELPFSPAQKNVLARMLSPFDVESAAAYLGLATSAQTDAIRALKQRFNQEPTLGLKQIVSRTPSSIIDADTRQWLLTRIDKLKQQRAILADLQTQARVGNFDTGQIAALQQLETLMAQNTELDLLAAVDTPGADRISSHHKRWLRRKIHALPHNVLSDDAIIKKLNREANRGDRIRSVAEALLTRN